MTTPPRASLFEPERDPLAVDRPPYCPVTWRRSFWQFHCHRAPGHDDPWHVHTGGLGFVTDVALTADDASPQPAPG